MRPVRTVITSSSLLILALALVSACQRDTTAPEPAAPQVAAGKAQALATIVVAPRGPVLPELGTSTTLTATGFDASGRVVRGTTVRWRSLNGNIVTVDPKRGIVTARATGQAIVAAEAGGVVGYGLVTVLSPGNPSMTWSSISTPAPAGQAWAALGVWGYSATEAYVGGQWNVNNTNTLIGFFWKWDGLGWQELPSPTETRIHSIWGPTPGELWVSSDGGLVRHLVNGTWTTTPTGVTSSIFTLWGAAPNDVWAAGAGGTLLHYDGNSWSRAASPTTQDLFAFWGSSGDDIWAAGNGGVLLHFTQGAWVQVPSPTTANLRGLWGAGPSAVWAAGGQKINERDVSGDTPTILRYDGNSWTSTTFNLPNTVAGIVGTSPTSIWTTGYAPLLAYFDGSTWTPTFTTGTVSAHVMWAIRPGIAFGVGTGILRANP